MQIIFGKRHTLSSWLIRAFTWSAWSHCGVIIDGNVYEASANDGVVITPLFDFVDRYKINHTTTIPCTSGWKDRAKKQVGKSYDWLAIINFLFRREWESEDKWICSEYVAYVSGIFNTDYISRVTPQHVLMVSE